MERRRARKRLMGEINVVPYIDVSLVLLVIFMITAPMLSQGVKVELPALESQPVSEEDAPPLLVSVTREGEITLDKRPIADSEALAAAIKAAQREQPGRAVYLGGDEAARYGRVLEVFVGLQQAGVEGLGLLTRAPGDGDAQ